MKNYFIHIRFRLQDAKGYVSDYGDYCLVCFVREDILHDFSGSLHFNLPSKEFVPGFQRNKDAKDISELGKAIQGKLVIT